jgi:peptidoglycan/LPS O-acetylase OafA/YrhL
VSSSNPTQGKIPSLDGWRALAVILVLVYHAMFASYYPYSKLAWTLVIFDGELGVRIFYVLSGFLISLLLLREGDKNGSISLRRFYLRRIFRIFPIYFAYLAVLGVLSAAGLYSDSLSAWVGCLTFTRNMVGHSPPSATSHFWSLAVEEQFYIIWPVLVYTLRLWKRGSLYVGLLLVPIFVCPVIRCFFISHGILTNFVERIFSPDSILAYADSLAVGCLGAWIVHRATGAGKWIKSHSSGMFICFAVIVGGRWLQVSFGGHAVESLVPAFQAWGIMGCLSLSTKGGSPGYLFLNSKPMATLGVLSYSIYVWHPLFLSGMMGPAFLDLTVYNWKFWIFPALGVGAFSYYCFELPLIGLRRKFRS